MTLVILIHYHEIALKGKNRSFFENKLVKNIKKTSGLKNYNKKFGRIVFKLHSKSRFNQLKKELSLIPGVANFSLAYQSDQKLEKIKKSILQLVKEKDFLSFRVVTSRSDKNYSLTSQETNNSLGASILKKTNAEVDLENPDLKIFVEIDKNAAYIYFNKLKGIGGLPVTTAGNLLCLLSGGIDSPVAAFAMIKRGAHVDFVHFHSYPKTSKASIEKVKKIAKKLNFFQFKSCLFLVPFFNFQKELFKNCNPRYLVLVYRQAMLKIAKKIGQKNNYLGLVSGESLGQVASQTLENMKVVTDQINFPIYRPLIGFNKQEIIKLAKKIKTFKISIQPHQDVCSLFVPKHPVTKATLQDFTKEKNKLKNYQKLIDQAIKKTEIIEI